MKRFNILSVVLIAAMLIASWSCGRFEDFKLGNLSTEMEFKPTVVAPLVYGSFSLQDVLEAIDSTGLVEQTEDSLLYIYYKDTAYSVVAADIIILPDKISTETYIESDITIPGWFTMLDGDTLTFNKTERMDFEIEADDQIDSVLLSSGNLNIIVSSEFRHSGELTITSSNIFDTQGDTLVLTFPISELDGSFYSDTDYPLAGYKFEIQEDAGMAYLELHYNLSLIKQTGEGVTIGETAEIQMSFENMGFSHIYGFVAEREVLNVSQSIDIKFYEAVASLAKVHFKDPQFNIYVHNSYGIPIEIDLSEIVARSTIEGTSTPLVFVDPAMSTFDVPAPTVDQLGQTITTARFINSETSNIADILVSSPDKIDFTIIANTGSLPGGGVQNFVLDTSKMIIETELVLPMWLQTAGYEIQDTLDMDLEGILGNLDFVENAKITLNTTNEWPLELNVQVYFLDSLGVVLDSMFDGNKPLLEAAPVDAKGELIKDLLFEVSNEVEFTGEEMSVLADTRQMWIKADASTTDNGTTYVKFYSHYLLHFDLSIIADFRINTSD